MSIRLHYTWILVFALVTAVVTTQFSETYPLWQRIILGIVVSLLFLVAVTIRELILSTAVFRGEIPVKKITLFVFGGVYPESQGRNISAYQPLQYLARFLSTLVIVVIFYGLYATFINADNLMLAGIAQWLTYIYALLFLLHFVPAFPLDGGAILRLILWRSTGNYYKATHTASLLGWATGFFLIFAGVLVFIITQQWIISLVIVSLGWIIQIAAGYTRRQIKTQMVLQHVKAEDVMIRDYPVMSPEVKIGQLIREQILKKGWQYVIVAEGTQFKGILTLNRIKSVPWKRWNKITIGEIMTPSGRLLTAHLQQKADTLFADIYQRGHDYIPVLEDANIVGVVTRSTLSDLVKARAGFGV